MKNFVWLSVIVYFFIYVFNVSAKSKPEFTIKIGKLKLDGVKDVDIDKKCTVFELTERINHAGGPLDNDSNYTVYVSYDKDNIYFACGLSTDLLEKNVKLDMSQMRCRGYIRLFHRRQRDGSNSTL
jgi:hypothetical protein